jgi:hypothetical protein
VTKQLIFLHFYDIIFEINKNTTPKRGEKIMQKLETQKSSSESDILENLKTHIKIEQYIPLEFRRAFYKDTGRPRGCTIESFMWYLILQSLTGIVNDNIFLFLVRIFRELREFCGFKCIPDASKISAFKQTFVEYIGMVFDNFVDETEPICRELDPKKSGYLIYDPTGIEAYVKENNPKFLNSKLNNAKKLAAKNPEINAHALAYSQMPEVSEANPFAQQQYINGYFCYAHKAGILANGLGIIRGIYVFDEQFKTKHPEVVSKKTDNPALDKEVGDSTSLKPVLSDFFDRHPNFSYHTFLGDSSFDSYDNYTMLRYDFKFRRICIPLNPRNSSSAHGNFDENGTPLCPIDNTPFSFLGICRGKNRSQRFKFVCPKSKPVAKTDCSCANPCTDSPYGRCVYAYPNNELRLYPGIPRATLHWDNLYRHRVLIERSIYLLKYPLGGAGRKTLSVRTSKADLFIAGISHLIGVILAFSTNRNELFKSVRKLFAA